MQNEDIQNERATRNCDTKHFNYGISEYAPKRTHGEGDVQNFDNKLLDRLDIAAALYP